MRAFAPYFEGKPSGLNPVSIIRSTPEFARLIATINKTVVGDFAAAGDYVQVCSGSPWVACLGAFAISNCLACRFSKNTERYMTLEGTGTSKNMPRENK